MRNKTLLKLLFTLLTICLVGVRGNLRSIEKRILDEILGGKYDSRIRPSGITNGSFAGDVPDKPAHVRVNTYVRSIGEIDDFSMDYKLQITFRAQWNDHRLKYDDMNGKIRYLSLTDPGKIWKPDIFFSNEKEGHFHNIMMPNVLLRIFPNGDILFSIRTSLVLTCPMDLQDYPFDTQHCPLLVVTYGYSTDDVVLFWKEGDPVQVSKNLMVTGFILETFNTDYCTSRTNTGEYSCLKLTFVLQRTRTPYLVQIFIPCCMMVIIAYLSFWIDPRLVTSRLFLTVITLFFLSAGVAAFNRTAPAVSYTRSVDTFTGMSLTFVFMSVIEFVVVSYLIRKESPRHSGHEGDGTDNLKTLEISDPATDAGKGGQVRNWFQAWFLANRSTGDKIDAIFRVAFPAAFLLFLFIYACVHIF